MRIIKYMIIGIALFSTSFSLLFCLTDKTEVYTVDNYVEEPCVYVTKCGDCYHAFSYHYLEQSKIEAGLYYARSNGYRACSYCGGTPYGTVEVNYPKTETKENKIDVLIQSIFFASSTVTVYMLVCVMIYVSKKMSVK